MLTAGGYPCKSVLDASVPINDYTRVSVARRTK